MVLTIPEFRNYPEHKPVIPKRRAFVRVLIFEDHEKTCGEALYWRDGKFRTSSPDAEDVPEVDMWAYLPSRTL